MLTKTRCMSLLNDIAGYAHSANIGPNGINEINEDYDGLKKLIEEHFNLKSLKFEEIKAGMWVYDLYSDAVIKVDETIVHRTDYNVNTTQRFVKHMNAVTLCITPYKKGRFYPVQIPVLEGEK